MIIAVMSALLWYFKFKISVFLFTRIANVLLAFRSFCNILPSPNAKKATKILPYT